MDDLIEKYYPIIESIDKKLWEVYAKLLERSINYLKTKNELTISTKIAATYVVKEIFLNSNSFNFNNIENIIDMFIIYEKNEYQSYMNNFALITDQFHADICFYKKFINQKINNF